MIDPGITRHNDVKGAFDHSTQRESVSHTGILREKNVYQEYMVI